MMTAGVSEMEWAMEVSLLTFQTAVVVSIPLIYSKMYLARETLSSTMMTMIYLEIIEVFSRISGILEALIMMTMISSKWVMVVGISNFPHRVQRPLVVLA
jgi:hypothetical protein